MGNLASIDDAIAAISRGEMIIVVDDEDRENEGDIVVSGAMITNEAVAFMMREARGLICVSLPGDKLDKLDIPLMVRRNSEALQTAFTVSVDAVEGISTGISAADRRRTIELLCSDNSEPTDFARPGHIFPLRANPGGVLARRGHTEAAVELTRLAGLPPCGVICEIANDDGTMARLPQLQVFAERFGLLIVSIEDLVSHVEKLPRATPLRLVAENGTYVDAGNWDELAALGRKAG